VRALLTVSPDERPDCPGILSMPQVQKWILLYFPEEGDDSSTQASDLLKTIVFPWNFMNLTDKLPRSAYDDLHPGVRLNVSPPSNKKEEEKI
jgi:hypothetical protein